MIGRKDRLAASALGTAGSKIGETDGKDGSADFEPAAFLPCLCTT